jgi:hypothetical protein
MKNRFFVELEKKLGMRYAVLTEDGAVMECDLVTWGRWLELNRSHRIIAQEQLPGGYFLSTVFLGLNHGYGKNPLWFETMIFEKPTGEKSLITGKEQKLGPELFCERYTTLAQALAGHQSAREKFLAGRL